MKFYGSPAYGLKTGLKAFQKASKSSKKAPKVGQKMILKRVISDQNYFRTLSGIFENFLKSFDRVMVHLEYIWKQVWKLFKKGSKKFKNWGQNRSLDWSRPQKLISEPFSKSIC